MNRIEIKRTDYKSQDNKHYASLTIYAAKGRRINIESRVKGIGMGWVKRGAVYVVFPPHKWGDPVPVEEIPNVEYRAVYMGKK